MWWFSDPYPEQTPEQLERMYDYIVLGGGTSGCVLARRLAEDRKCSVLLVERGDAGDSWWHRIPLLSAWPWCLRSHNEVLEATSDVLGHKLDVVTGYGLGGTSRVNSMQYSRGVPGEYNAWAEDGREGWSYGDLEPYFEKAECLYKPVTKSHYGSEGLWRIKAPPRSFNFGFVEHVVRACQKLGLPHERDVNDPKLPTFGTFNIHHTIDESGNRHSTFRAFLPKDFAKQHAGNLHICTNTVVRKVEVTRADDGSLRATGAQIQASSSRSLPVSVLARKEVVVCCGPLRSPQILMLSGVGPEKHLQEMGIPVIRKSEGVGSTLQDHIYAHVDFQCPMEDSLLGILRSPRLVLRELYNYIAKGSGWLCTSLVEVCILTRAALVDESSQIRPFTSAEVDSSNPQNVPDIEIMLSAICEYRLPEVDKSRGVFQFLCALLRPKSMGTVRLRSSDPMENPLCDLNCLTSPDDYEVLRRAIKLSLRIADEMKAAGYPLTPLHVPATLDNATVDAFIHEWAASSFHPSSTCRMAPEDDAVAPGVVDDALRVHGIENLRICDTSIFPQIPAAHLQAPAVVIAEKCADMIKAAADPARPKP